MCFFANRFEKYIGGKYLGELQRVILKKLWNENLLFKKYSDKAFLLSEPWTFGSDNVSNIDRLVFWYIQ